MTHKGWIASTSDGQTIFEATSKPGDRSPWQQFLAFTKENNIDIRGMRLQRGGVNLHAMSHKICNGFYQAYEAHKTMYSNVDLRMQGIGSVLELQGLYVFVNWVDDNGNVWQDVRPLEGEKIHTTLR